MSSDNFVQIVGTVGGDPEMRFTTGGLAVCSFSVAWSPRKREGDKWVDGETSWFRCTAWRDMAENIASSIQKGDRVVVTGQVSAREWEDRNGDKRTSVEIQVDECAPSLRWATASVNKTEREKGEGAGNYKPAGGAAVDPVYGDEEPF